jgi:hypothetical protein
VGLGRLLQMRSTQYTATDTVTGATWSGVVLDNLGPDWPSVSAYQGGLSIPGAWRASVLLSDLLGLMPWDAYRQPIGRPEVKLEPTPPLLEQPYPPDSRMTSFSSWGLDLIWEGNAIAVIAARNALNWPTAAIPVPAANVSVRRVTRFVDSPLPVGALEYKIGSMSLGSQDVIHIKGPCRPGDVRGMGVLEAHLNTFGLAREQDRQARSVSTHGVPTGVLKSDNPDLTDDEAADLKSGWLASQQTRTIAVLNASTTFTALSWNPEQLQLVEARKMTLNQLELVFGLPIGWLGGTDSSRKYCADTETEILTEDGWRRYDQLLVGDICLTLNIETGLAEWQPVEAVHVFDGPHDVIRMRSQTHSSVTTADHRWPTFPGAGYQMVPRWRWRTTARLNSSDRIRAAAVIADLPVDAKWADAFVELVGWFWTEGHIEPSGSVSIGQSRAANPGHVDRIRAALIALYGPPTVPLPSRPTGKPAWRERVDGDMSLFRITAAAARPLLDAAPDKVMSMPFLRSLTSAQLELLLQVSIWADGSVTNSGTPVIAQRSLARLEAFQLACVLAGRSGTIRQHQSGMWCLAIHKNPWKAPAGHQKYVTADRIDGPVWCPTTGNATWFARRDGTTYFTGNSNMSQDDVHLMKYSLGGHVARFEQALSLAFPRGTVARANLDAVLRADTLTRYQAHSIALGGKPFLTEDEVRDYEHRGPMPEKPAEPDLFAATRSDFSTLEELEVRAGNDEQLHHYWTKGEGLAQWADSPHPWTALYHHLAKYVDPERAKRMAAQWYHEVMGHWPGEHKGKRG